MAAAVVYKQLAPPEQRQMRQVLQNTANILGRPKVWPNKTSDSRAINAVRSAWRSYETLS